MEEFDYARAPTKVCAFFILIEKFLDRLDKKTKMDPVNAAYPEMNAASSSPGTTALSFALGRTFRI
jgi:hypothetical protein